MKRLHKAVKDDTKSGRQQDHQNGGGGAFAPQMPDQADADQNGKDDECHRLVDEEQHEEGRDDLDARNEEFLGAVVRELGHVEQIARDTRHERADLGVVVVGKGQLLLLLYL